MLLRLILVFFLKLKSKCFFVACQPFMQIFNSLTRKVAMLKVVFHLFTISYLLVSGLSSLARSVHKSFNQTVESIRQEEN